jgi:cytochrome c oxidase cbb3-type subunit 2
MFSNTDKNIGLMIVMILIVASIGGIVQLVPLYFQKSVTQPIEGLKPHSALHLAGREIYLREQCVSCHSQMIRPLRAETERYGHYSVAGESVYERPFQWGSKRTGPDLARVGGRYSDQWHRLHLIDPRSVVPESIMPGYPWLETKSVDAQATVAKMKALKKLGHPYAEEEINNAAKQLEGRTEMDAMVAYLQGLGTILTSRR